MKLVNDLSQTTSGDIYNVHCTKCGRGYSEAQLIGTRVALSECPGCKVEAPSIVWKRIGDLMIDVKTGTYIPIRKVSSLKNLKKGLK
jgi:NAD-dependent SIR2 family protein deacetylase